MQNKLKKLPQKYDLSIENDARLLFNGEKSGHLNHLMYGTPEFAGDNVQGSGYWVRIRQSKEYYIRQEDDQLLMSAVIKDFIEQQVEFKNLIDLGPGDATAVYTKTVPLLRAVNAKRYVAVDLDANYARDSALLVETLSNVEGDYLVNDFINEKLPIKDGSSIVFLGGGTIGNIPVDLRIKDAGMYLAHVFSSLKRSLKKKDQILIGFDANQDEAMLREAYCGELNARAVKDILFRIERDTRFNFDPNSFALHAEWIAAEYRFAHYLMAQEDVEITGPEQECFQFKKGHKLHVQNSYKFPPEMMSKAAENAGWKTKKIWTETGRVHYMLFEAV